VQLLPADIVGDIDPQLPVLNEKLVVSDSEMLDTSRLAVPVLDIVMVCAEEELPTAILPKSWLAGETEMSGTGRASPVPVIWMGRLAWSGSLELIVSVSSKSPADWGLKVTDISQLPPADMVGELPPQVPVSIEKLVLSDKKILDTTRSAVPALEIVNVCGADKLPAITLPKSWLENRTVYPRFVTTNGTDEKDCVHNGYRTIDDRSDPSEPYENSIENYSDQGADELRRFLWNIAIGLDSRFLANETSVTRYFDDWSTYWDLISFGDKLENLLIDRFRFNTEVSKSNMLNRLDEEKDYIISTLNRNEPILLIMKGVNQNNDSAGHAVIIDGYVLGSNNYLNLKINMGWGNRSSTNEILYPSHGSFDSGGYTWQEFHIYKNTTPNTDSDPIATIISPNSSVTINQNESINFQGNVEGGNAPLNYFWDFDSGADNSNLEDPGNVTFQTAGTFTVEFTVTDADADSSSDTVIITVTDDNGGDDGGGGGGGGGGCFLNALTSEIK